MKMCKTLLTGVIVAVAGFIAAPAQAASGTWTNTASGGLWSATGNWSGGTVADGSGNTADFSTIDITADNTVHLDSARTIGNLIFGDTATGTAAGWILDNNGNAANILTLAGGTPTITVNALGSGKIVTISAVVDGSAGLAKAGAGILRLSGANIYSGGTVINAGSLQANNNNAFGTGLVTVNSGGQAYLNGAFIVTNDFTIAGTGPDGFGAIRLQQSTITGTITLAGDARIGAGNAGGNGAISGRITGSGALTLGNAAFPAPSITLSNVAGNNDWTGGTTIGIGSAQIVVVKLGANNQIPDGASAGNVTINTAGALDLNGHNETINGLSGTSTTAFITNSAAGNSTLTVGANNASGNTYAGLINDGAGTLALVKTGTGDQTLSGANSYAGGTTINAGRLVANNNSAYGTGLVTVNSGGQAFLSSFTHANDFTIAGTGIGDNLGAIRLQSATLNGTITLAANAAIGAGNGSGVINGKITGANALTFGGAAGSPQSITLNNAAGNNDWTGGTTIGIGSAQLVVVKLGADNQIPDGASAGNVTINTAGALDLNGHNETINGLSGTSTTAFITNSAAGNSTLTVGANNASGASFAGSIGNGAGTLALTKIGTGTQTLTGINTYSGGTMISNGTLIINGQNTGSGATKVFSGGILGGTGTVTGPVTVDAGGTIAPGNSPGIFNVGNLTLTNNAVAAFELNGTTVGTQYDQLNVTGSVDLDSHAILALSLGYSPAQGDSFTIINNDLADAISGLFKLADNTVLTQGSEFQTAGSEFKINYFGGTGNDLVLTVVPEPSVVALLALAVCVILRRRQ